MNYLEKILATKLEEIEELNSLEAYEEEFKSYPRQDIRHIHWNGNLDVIAEIKRKSPSKGELAEIKNPGELAKKYEQGGAALISVLTDEKYFGAEKDDLTIVREHISIPVIRKDFIIDERQVYQSYFMGTDVILLIVQAFEDNDKLLTLFKLAQTLGLEVLVEAHDQHQYKVAESIGASIIGVNTRDLTTFEENIDLAKEIFSNKSSDPISVWESGIKTIEDAKRAYEFGAEALLIGQGLVQNDDPAKFIEQIRHIS